MFTWFAVAAGLSVTGDWEPGSLEMFSRIDQNSTAHLIIAKPSCDFNRNSPSVGPV